MPPKGDPIRVLHVDDDPEFAALVADRLERADEGLDIEPVTAVAEALDRIGDADCVVSDYDMPDRDGIEFLRAVREEHPDLPFVLYTNAGSEAVASEAVSAGVTDYLQKDPGPEQYALLANTIRNAVERARAEEARRRQLDAIETAREGISILSEDGEFIYVNEAYAALYGYDRETLLGEHWSLVYPGDEVDFAREEVIPTVSEEGYWHGETTGLRADGETFPEDHVVSRTATGDLVCTVRDLSDRREREAELRLQHRAMDEAPVGITISDPDREDNPLVYVNERFEAITGYDREAILGSNCRFLQGPDTDPEQVAAIREAVDAGEPVSVELLNYREDGTAFWNRVKIAPIEDEDGTVVNWVGFQEDITERKERERELRRYERMVNAMDEAACIYDDEGCFAVVNEYLAEFYGTTPEALEGEPSNLIPAVREQHEGDPYRALLDGDREEVRGEIEATFPGHGREVLAYRLTPLSTDGEIEGVVGVAREVTERRARERRLERQNERLEEFASIVSHDLRNPLNVAQGRVDLAREECETEHLEDAADALDRSQALIDDLLTLAREGGDIGEVEAVALGDLASQCWTRIGAESATLSVETGRTIRADPSRLQQLLENLFRNAVEHGPTGDRASPEDAAENDDASVTVTVGATEDGFYVADDGSGIPAEERDRVFEAGFSTDEDGTGFGLSIVARIAEAHGWEVELTESEAGGARFSFTGVETVE